MAVVALPCAVVVVADARSKLVELLDLEMTCFQSYEMVLGLVNVV